MTQGKRNYKGVNCTFGWSQGQQDDHGVDHQDVHGGGLPCSPAQEHLVLGLGLENNNKNTKFV